MRVHQSYQGTFVCAQPRSDPFGQSPCAWHLDPLLDQKVDTAPEDEPGLEMRTRHRRDLRRQSGFSLIVKRSEALYIQDDLLVAQTSGLGVMFQCERIGGQIDRTGDPGDVAFMVGIWQKEPS